MISITNGDEAPEGRKAAQKVWWQLRRAGGRCRVSFVRKQFKTFADGWRSLPQLKLCSVVFAVRVCRIAIGVRFCTIGSRSNAFGDRLYPDRAMSQPEDLRTGRGSPVGASPMSRLHLGILLSGSSTGENRSGGLRR
jgi:hypothetical protein